MLKALNFSLDFFFFIISRRKFFFFIVVTLANGFALHFLRRKSDGLVFRAGNTFKLTVLLLLDTKIFLHISSWHFRFILQTFAWSQRMYFHEKYTWLTVRHFGYFLLSVLLSKSTGFMSEQLILTAAEEQWNERTFIKENSSSFFLSLFVSHPSAECVR